MKDPILEIVEEKPSNSPSRGPGEAGLDHGGLEARVGERVDAKLAEIKKSIADGLGKFQERLTPVIDERIKRALSGSFAALTNTTKEALTQVVQAILFDSGILERLVSRIIDEKLPTKPSGGSEAVSSEALSSEARKETQDLIQKEITRALASEQMKMVIDDKFRAISLYLKSDVIPRAVQEALRTRAPTRAKASQDAGPAREGGKPA